MKLTLLFLFCCCCATAQTNIDLCGSVHCHDYGGANYQVLVLPAPIGILRDFTILAREHRYSQSGNRLLTHLEPTVHLSFYATRPDAGVKDNETPVTFSQDFSTNNGLFCQRLTNALPQCLDTATNVWLLRMALNITNQSAYLGFWFLPACKENWTVPPLYPPFGMVPTTFQSCRYANGTNIVHWFKPLYNVGGYNRDGFTGYFGVPYAIFGRPKLTIAKAGPQAVTVSWETNDTNLWLVSPTWRMPATNHAVLPMKRDETLWLEQ